MPLQRLLCFLLAAIPGLALINVPTSAFTAKSSFADTTLPAWARQTGANTFPKGTKAFHVNDFGASANSNRLSTKPIQAAIDKCFSEGGGTVDFEPGKYITGSLFVK